MNDELKVANQAKDMEVGEEAWFRPTAMRIDVEGHYWAKPSAVRLDWPVTRRLGGKLLVKPKGGENMMLLRRTEGGFVADISFVEWHKYLPSPIPEPTDESPHRWIPVEEVVDEDR